MEKTNMENITFRPLAETDWLAINSLCERRLGEGYLDYDDFLFRVSFPGLNLVAEADGEAVAMVSVTPAETPALASAEQMDEEKLRKDLDGKEGLRFRTAICHENYEGKGITKALLEKVIENAKNMGYGVILSMAWKYEGKLPTGKLHEETGFIDLGERRMPWYNQKGYTCVICKGPCRCNGELFELIL